MQNLLWVLVLISLSCQTHSSKISAPARQPPRPNILFIYADDLGYGDLGSYGHPFARTPNLDQLAQDGTRFTQFYMSHSLCSPSRASAITGQYPSRHRIFRPIGFFKSNAQVGMPHWLDVRAPSFPRALQRAGYRTAMIGKWHLGGGSGSQIQRIREDTMDEGPRPRPRSPAYINHPDAPAVTEYGFDFARTTFGNGPTWYNAEPYPEPHQVYPYSDRGWLTWSSKAIANAAVEFLKDHTRNYDNQPFMLNLWLKDPHTPLKPTEEMRRLYADVEEPSQTHYAMITFMDEQIGRLLATLSDLGLGENTLVIFSSDNGAAEGRGGSNGSLRGWKWYLYEGGIRVTFIVRWPGRVPAGRVDHESALNICDLVPTLSRLTGARMPADYEPDGVDISDVLEGRPFERPTPMMWHHPLAMQRSPQLAIRSGDWKLLMDPDGNRLELYDLAEDASESENLVAEKPEIVARLKENLLDWYASIPHPEDDY